jgi:hypothetical protein
MYTALAWSAAATLVADMLTSDEPVGGIADEDTDGSKEDAVSVAPIATLNPPPSAVGGEMPRRMPVSLHVP